jgi:hypothetical protein
MLIWPTVGCMELRWLRWRSGAVNGFVRLVTVTDARRLTRSDDAKGDQLSSSLSSQGITYQKAYPVYLHHSHRHSSPNVSSCV